MVAFIPEGVYTMKDKSVIINHNAKAYQKASKEIKSRMLQELSEILHMNRQYLATLLRKAGHVIFRRGRLTVIADPSLKELSKRGRKRLYGEDVIKALKKIWRISGFVSSKHLVGFIRLNHEILFKHPDIKRLLTGKTETLLLMISHSTVDRVLKPYRDKVKLKCKYKGNPYSSNLKKSIKVESWYDKPKETGYVEIDLVHHSGAVGKGEFIYTLTATEVFTGWTELMPIRNKAMVWTKAALDNILRAMSMPVKKLHSDNGSEFINAHVQRFCMDRKIQFTRSRPYRKNDAPFVESKNWSMVRAYTGWRRYDAGEELDILQRLLRVVSLKQNLFMPQMKLIHRHREGGKIVKAYEMDIPLNRVLRVDTVDASKKTELIRLRNTIDIVALSEKIEELSEALASAYEKKLRRHKYA